MRLSLAAALVSLSAFALAGPGLARAQRSDNDTQDNPRARAGRQVRSAPSGGQGRGLELEAVPEGWIRIATDTNGDGRYDRFELVHIYDLEMARQQSARRSRGGSSGRGQKEQVEGDILSMRKLKLVGIQGAHKEHQLVRIETEQGHNIRADLGPPSALEDLGLGKGKRVEVTGVIGTINDRPVLMADSVTVDDKTVQVRLPESRGHRRFHVQVLSTRKARFKKQDGEHLVARVRLLNGQQVQALLGPTEKLKELNVKDGDSLDILAHPGRLNSEPVLVAEQVHSGGKVVSVEREEGQAGRKFESGSNDSE